MNLPDIFFNGAGRLRSGWRLAIFIGIYLIVVALVQFSIMFMASLVMGAAAGPFLEGNMGWVVQALMLFIPAAVVGWLCCLMLEELPWRSLGWGLHRGWLRDLLKGSLIGAASLLLAATLAAVFGGLRFAFVARMMPAEVGKTLLVSGLIFILAAAAEEMLFRGYPLQTLARARLAWFGLLITSVLFASVHLNNPNVVRGFTFINTLLAGIWLGMAYLRTRSLWLPLGIHWSWNWTMGAVLGLPVSGIERLTPAPLMRAVDAGPAWLTGGAYGIEGGAACTLALILSTLFIWRTRLLSPNEEMKRLTSEENPRPDYRPVHIYERPSEQG
ncbi:MAG TPA: type II CAAX endopeptidase family protein [Pyrinomonadaceae bacterium]|jgi:hypothetical protein